MLNFFHSMLAYAFLVAVFGKIEISLGKLLVQSQYSSSGVLAVNPAIYRKGHISGEKEAFINTRTMISAGESSRKRQSNKDTLDKAIVSSLANAFIAKGQLVDSASNPRNSTAKLSKIVSIVTSATNSLPSADGKVRFLSRILRLLHRLSAEDQNDETHHLKTSGSSNSVGRKTVRAINNATRSGSLDDQFREARDGGDGYGGGGGSYMSSSGGGGYGDGGGGEIKVLPIIIREKKGEKKENSYEAPSQHCCGGPQIAYTMDSGNNNAALALLAKKRSLSTSSSGSTDSLIPLLALVVGALLAALLMSG